MDHETKLKFLQTAYNLSEAELHTVFNVMRELADFTEFHDCSEQKVYDTFKKIVAIINDIKEVNSAKTN